MADQPGDRKPGESEDEYAKRIRANGKAATKLKRQVSAHDARAAKAAKRGK